MPTFDSFADAAKPYADLIQSLERNGLRNLSMSVGRRMQAIAESAASADLGGDPKFSGWVAALETKLTPTRTDPGIILSPTRSSAGPWTVATVGRNQGETGAFLGPGANRNTGLTARTKAGNVRKVRSFQRRRWNGTTRGKGTADRAVAEFQRQLPQLIREGVIKHINEHLT